MGPKKPYLLTTHFSWNFSTHPLISYPYLKGLFLKITPFPNGFKNKTKLLAAPGSTKRWCKPSTVGSRARFPKRKLRLGQRKTHRSHLRRRTSVEVDERSKAEVPMGSNSAASKYDIFYIFNYFASKRFKLWKVFLKNKSGANLYVAFFLHLNDQALSRLGLCQWCPNVPTQKLLRRPAQRWHPSANTRVPTKRRRLNLKLQWNASYK